ncbi:hypothetical protein NPIL_215251 [Nephila pilipes]|uniref:Uncharacterized protein n=1 Tax=Nephila pilipes TaxID=299642 RepID=A0A8X6NY17_NEPPI|nr:hypothetical protein NPIL_215251 [Nephila pilipes]
MEAESTCSNSQAEVRDIASGKHSGASSAKMVSCYTYFLSLLLESERTSCPLGGCRVSKNLLNHQKVWECAEVWERKTPRRPSE